MEYCSHVTLVISGKSYPNIPKDVLTENSEYFKALFSGRYADSNENVWHFPEWSTLAFEEMLNYMYRRRASFKGKRIDTIEKMVQISQFICCDSFLQDQRNTLIESWAEIGFKNACSLAACLGLDVEEEIIQDSLETANCILYSTPGELKHNAFHTTLTYEHLQLALRNDNYWQNRHYQGGYCYDFFWYLTREQNQIINWILKNPPHLNNIRRLCQYLKLEILPWNNVKYALCESVGNPLSKKCLKLAFQHQFSILRDEIGNRISHLRLAFSGGGKKTRYIGVVEFNLDTWTWEIIHESKRRFSATYCVLSRDYANFMGDAGLMIFRKKNHKPKSVNHIYIREVFKNYVIIPDLAENDITNCVVGKTIYLLVQHSPLENDPLWYSKPTLFKLDVFTHEFEYCTKLNMYKSVMVGHGNSIYIAGFNSENPNFQKFQIVSLNVVTNILTTIIEINDFDESVPQISTHFLILKKSMLYIFFSCQYIIVDTRKSVDQIIEFKTLECFFTQGWNFNICQVCSVKDGVIFLLDIRHNAQNCLDSGYMIAQLNTDSNVFQSFGFLPRMMPVLRYSCFLDFQIEERTAKSPPLFKSKEFVQGILDLENLPEHRHF